MKEPPKRTTLPHSKMFGLLNYNTMMGESKMSKKPRQFRIDADLLERFDRVNERLYVNGSEVVRRLIKEYVEEKEKELGLSGVNTASPQPECGGIKKIREEEKWKNC